jgi:hypothetical protein
MAGKRGEHLRQRQPDDAEHLAAAGRRQAEGREGVPHGRADGMLTVDQRAVAIEDDELHAAAYSIGRVGVANYAAFPSFITCSARVG